MPGGIVAAVEAGAIALAGVANLAVARRARHEEGPAVESFVTMAAGIGVMALEVAVVLAVVGSDGALWETATMSFWTVSMTAWGAFVLSYTGHGEYTRGRRRDGLWTATATVVLITVADTLGFGVFPDGSQSSVGLVGAVLGVVYLLSLLLVLGVAVAGISLVIGAARDAERFDRPLAVLVLAVVGSTWIGPWIGFSVTNTLSVPWLDGLVLVAGTAVAAGANWLAIDRYGLFDATPAAAKIGPETVVETMGDAVVVVDPDGRIADCNPAAREVFDGESASIIDAPLADVVGAELSALERRPTITVDTARGRRQYEPEVSVIDGENETIGHTVVLRDVTEQRTRRQRLAVLNRVLRHNLRNDVTAIAGYSEMIADGDQRPEDVAGRITDMARDLAATGEKAREVEHLMGEPRVSNRRVELAAVVEDVADRFRAASPAATVETSVPDGLALALNESVLETVLAQLVENAIEHHDGDPTVGIAASVDPDHTHPLAVSVSDDGPGIPEHEREAISEGEETPLQHGSGLGLWVVSWGVSRLGGTVGFEENDPRGSVVTVRLPEQVEEFGAASTEEAAGEPREPSAVAE